MQRKPEWIEMYRELKYPHQIYDNSYAFKHQIRVNDYNEDPEFIDWCLANINSNWNYQIISIDHPNMYMDHCIVSFENIDDATLFCLTWT